MILSPFNWQDTNLSHRTACNGNLINIISSKCSASCILCSPGSLQSSILHGTWCAWECQNALHTGH